MVPVGSAWADRGALEKAGVFGADNPLRTGTVRGPAGAVSNAPPLHGRISKCPRDRGRSQSSPQHLCPLRRIAKSRCFCAWPCAASRDGSREEFGHFLSVSRSETTTVAVGLSPRTPVNIRSGVAERRLNGQTGRWPSTVAPRRVTRIPSFRGLKSTATISASLRDALRTGTVRERGQCHAPSSPSSIPQNCELVLSI